MNLEIPERDLSRPKKHHNDDVIKSTVLIVGAAKCGTIPLATHVRANFDNVCRFLEVSDYVPDDLRVHNPGREGHPLVKWAMRNCRWLRSGLRPFTSKVMRLALMERLQHINVRGGKQALDDSTRAKRSEIFAPEVQRMEELLGRKRPAWKPVL